MVITRGTISYIIKDRLIIDRPNKLFMRNFRLNLETVETNKREGGIG